MLPWLLVFHLLWLLLVVVRLLSDNDETVDESAFLIMSFWMLEGLVCLVVCTSTAAAVSTITA